MLLCLALPGWLTNEKDITLATWGLVAATFLLFLVTVALLIDSRAKSKDQAKRWEREDASRVKEQQARWDREDQLRADDAKPKVVVELAKREANPEIFFSCFNLGSTLFFIDQMIITVSMGSTHTLDLVGPPVVLPGTFVYTPFDGRELLRDGMKEANAVFVLRGSHGSVRTEPVWFYFYPDEAGSYEWGLGRLSDRKTGVIVRQPRSIPGG